MTTTLTNPTSEAAPDEWRWPIQIGQFDRTPTLTTAELETLSNRVRSYSAHQAAQVARSGLTLQRLMTPINTVLTFMDVTPESERTARHIMAKEMARRQSAFWGWTTEMWAETLQADATQFGQYHLGRRTQCRNGVLAVAYLLGDFVAFERIGLFLQPRFAARIFGPERFDQALTIIATALAQLGMGRTLIETRIPQVLALALLVKRSPLVADMTLPVLTRVRDLIVPREVRRDCMAISRAFVSLGIIAQPLPRSIPMGPKPVGGLNDCVSEEWVEWCKRWYGASTEALHTRENKFNHLLKAGRWLMVNYPHVTSPAGWTREIAAAFVSAVDRMHIGEWSHPLTKFPAHQVGKPLTPNTKSTNIAAVRTFFVDCQEWQWLPVRFEPRRALATPRSIEALRGPNPRVIADDIWAKLMHAGLNLTPADLPVCTYRSGETTQIKLAWYPLELVQAITLVWLFTGLRCDEIYRLRVGCIRWQQPDAPAAATTPHSPTNVCLLDVPVNKTSTAFVKPVDRLVGEAINNWEKLRPKMTPMLDPKTNELVDFLFVYRGKHVGYSYLNTTVIPMLCRKAGVPEQDARGNIRSHRARSTIATQLYNAKEPMSLFELQEWLGHRSPASTQHYAKITPTKLTKAYQDAGYFGRNMRMVEVLIDQEAIRSGATLAGEAWKYYDLGHGYCTYDFFDQCPHRMACPKCSFYRPKGSSTAQILEAKANLVRMHQEIPLSDEERSAVEDGLEALEKLSQQLLAVPTPAGPTPQQLLAKELAHKRQLPMASQ